MALGFGFGTSWHTVTISCCTAAHLQAINKTSEVIECTHSRVDLDRILGLQVGG